MSKSTLKRLEAMIGPPGTPRDSTETVRAIRAYLAHHVDGNLSDDEFITAVYLMMCESRSKD